MKRGRDTEDEPAAPPQDKKTQTRDRLVQEIQAANHALDASPHHDPTLVGTLSRLMREYRNWGKGVRDASGKQKRQGKATRKKKSTSSKRRASSRKRNRQ